MNALLSLIAQEKSSGGLGALLPLLILAPVAYLMFSQSRKQKKQQAELLANLRVGDDIVTSGGIYGTVTFLEDKIAHVEIDTDVVIRVTKTSLTRLSPTAAADDADEAEETVIDLDDSATDPDPDATGGGKRAKQTKR